MTVNRLFRIPSCSRASWRVPGVEAGPATGRWQDKTAHIARRSRRCFCWDFRCAPHIAWLCRNVRNRFKAFFLRDFLNIAGQRDGR